MKEKMRKFKFRVYDSKRKMFVTEHRSHSGLISISVDGTINYEYSTWNSDHLVIQQYTGMDDLDGKEIYEGDLVKLPKGWFYEERVASVVFHEQRNGWMFLFETGQVECLSECFIIGNIFDAKNSDR